MVRTIFLRLLMSRTPLLLTLASILLTTGLAVSGRMFVSIAKKQPLDSTVEPKQALTMSPERQRRIADFESELLTITSHGFEPQEIIRPQGRILLMFENRTSLRAVTVRISTEGGERLREVSLPLEQPDWSDIVDLPAGHYQLTEVDHPRWTCQVTITPR